MSNNSDIPIYIVDAFADQPFAGNPAAVCVLPAWPRESLLLSIADEMNLSETAFLVGRAGVYEIRWFTPLREVDLIGHATLAAALVVLDRLERGLKRVLFRSGGETIGVEKEGHLLAMDFPALRSAPVENGAPIGRALRASPQILLAGKHYMAVFGSAGEIRDMNVDMPAIAALDLPAVIVTAPGEESEVDFVSRFFAPANGVPEDPVSGVAHLALVPFWSRRLGRKRLVGRQLSRRGGTVIGVDRGSRVTLMGPATLVLSGVLHSADISAK